MRLKYVRARNFLVLLGSNLAAKGAWFVSIVLLMNYLDPAAFGLLASLWAIGAVAAGFSDVGVGQVLLRDGAREPGLARSIARKTLVLQIVLSLILFSIVTASALTWLPSPGLDDITRVTVFALSIATMLMDRFSALFTVFSQLSGDYRRISLYRSVYFLCLLGSFTVAMDAQVGLDGVAQLYFVWTVVFTCLMAWVTWRVLPYSTQTTNESMLSLARQGFWFLGNTGLSIAYGRIEVVLLGLFGFMVLAGAYHVAYQIVLLFFSISGIFFTVIYARLYAHQGHAMAVREDFVDTLRWLSIFAWMAAPPMILYTDQMAQLLGSDALVAHADTLRVLSLMICLLPAAAALDFLPTLELAKQRVYAEASGLGLTLVLTIILLVLDAPEAISWAALVGYIWAVGLAYRFAASKRVLMLADLLHETWRVAWPALIALVLVLSLPWSWWQISLVYSLLFLLLLFFTRHPAATKMMDTLRAALRH